MHLPPEEGDKGRGDSQKSAAIPNNLNSQVKTSAVLDLKFERDVAAPISASFSDPENLTTRVSSFARPSSSIAQQEKKFDFAAAKAKGKALLASVSACGAGISANKLDF